MKVKVRRGRVIDIAKTLPPDDADGENVGVVKFGATARALLTTLLDAGSSAGGLRDWAPKAFAEFAQLRPLHAIGTRGFPWTEIDFPEDYERAVARSCRRSRATLSPAPASTPSSSNRRHHCRPRRQDAPGWATCRSRPLQE